MKGARACADHFTRVWIDGGSASATAAWSGAPPPLSPSLRAAQSRVEADEAAIGGTIRSGANIGQSAQVCGFSHMRDDFTEEWCDDAESSLGMQSLSLTPQEVAAFARSMRLAAEQAAGGKGAGGSSKGTSRGWAKAAAAAAMATPETAEERAVRKQVALKLRTMQQYEAIVCEREVRKQWLRETGMLSIEAGPFYISFVYSNPFFSLLIILSFSNSVQTVSS